MKLYLVLAPGLPHNALRASVNNKMAASPTRVMAPEKGKLSEGEKKLLEHAGQGNLEEVKRLLCEPGVRVDCLDENGMTPLLNSAYKAQKDVCEVLLAHGADVNTNHHNHGYSGLMFAALSGNVAVTQVILEAGANVNYQNSVGRTASQMAAFVGQHSCVSLINNFLSREDLEYYTRPQGLEKEPKLPPALAPALYRYVLITNLNPVKLSLHLQQNLSLLDDSYKVAKVLELLCEKQMKQSETNEVMGLKFHYLATVVRQAEKSRQDKADNLEGWIKNLLRARESDGCMEFQEHVVRSLFRDFPYAECQIIQQCVRTLAAVKIGDSPSALSTLNSAINGQRFASDEDEVCSSCGDVNKQCKKCSKCKMVRYCNVNCQKLHWFTHKKFCKDLAVQYIEIEKQRKRMDEEEQKRKEQEELEKQMKAAEIEQNGETATDKDEAVTTNGVHEQSEPDTKTTTFDSTTSGSGDTAKEVPKTSAPEASAKAEEAASPEQITLTES